WYLVSPMLLRRPAGGPRFRAITRIHHAANSDAHRPGERTQHGRARHQRCAAPDLAGTLGTVHARKLSAADRQRPGAAGGAGSARPRNGAGAKLLYQHLLAEAGTERL